MNRERCDRCQELERELEKSRRRAERLQRRIQAARAACNWWISAAQLVLSRKGGVPRGRWSFARGAHRAASHIAAMLEGGDG